MAKTTITILNDSRVSKCDAGCAVNWSKNEEIERAREQLKRQLRDDFVLEYLDMVRPEVERQFAPVVQKTRKAKADFLYPLLIINGEIRISGDFDLRMLADMIDAAREMGIV